jgi:hypothetical protein
LDADINPITPDITLPQPQPSQSTHYINQYGAEAAANQADIWTWGAIYESGSPSAIYDLLFRSAREQFHCYVHSGEPVPAIAKADDGFESNVQRQSGRAMNNSVNILSYRQEMKSIDERVTSLDVTSDISRVFRCGGHCGKANW